MRAAAAPEERKSSNCKIYIYQDGARHKSDIHVIDMGGWQLFECFLHAGETVVYLSMDEGEQTPKWIDMGDAEDEKYARLLIEALSRFEDPVPKM